MSPAKATPKKKTTRRKATAKKASSKSGSAKGKKAAPKKAAKVAAKAKPKPAAKAPRKGTKARLAAVLERLDKTYGVIEPPDDAPTMLEKAVYLVLREGGSSSAVEKAIASLREEFVDWNEVRVSSASELARLMSGSSKPGTLRRWHERAQRLRDMIDEVYNDRNEPDLEFLADAKPKDQIEFLEDLDDLGVHNAYALVQWVAGEFDKLVIVSSEMAGVCKTLGLTDSAAMSKVKKELTSQLEPGRAMSCQAHLNKLGDLEPDEWPASMKEFVD